jgi:hypothetical protein
MKRIQFRSSRYDHRHMSIRKTKAAEKVSVVVLAAAAGGLLWAENAGKLPPKGTLPIY